MRRNPGLKKPCCVPRTNPSSNGWAKCGAVIQHILFPADFGFGRAVSLLFLFTEGTPRRAFFIKFRNL
jgi:hypothetical protein